MDNPTLTEQERLLIEKQRKAREAARALFMSPVTGGNIVQGDSLWTMQQQSVQVEDK